MLTFRFPTKLKTSGSVFGKHPLGLPVTTPTRKNRKAPSTNFLKKISTFNFNLNFFQGSVFPVQKYSNSFSIGPPQKRKANESVYKKNTWWKQDHHYLQRMPQLDCPELNPRRLVHLMSTLVEMPELPHCSQGQLGRSDSRIHPWICHWPAPPRLPCQHCHWCPPPIPVQARRLRPPGECRALLEDRAGTLYHWSSTPGSGMRERRQDTSLCCCDRGACWPLGFPK